MLEKRRSLPFEEVYRLSAIVQKRFLSSAFFKQAASLALYASFSNEIMTDDIWAAAVKDDKKVYFPRVVKPTHGAGAKHLEFFMVDSLDDLAPGTYEVREPKGHGEKIEVSEIGLAVVPGLAFDAKGGRLGFGKGYYDMALSKMNCPVVALAYDFQVLKHDLPMSGHDVRVIAIVTETRIIVI